jgi:hypothetical protein
MENQMNGEKIFFQQGNVLVSQFRLVIGVKTYVMRNISSVSTASDCLIKRPSKILYKILIGIAFLLLLGTIQTTFFYILIANGKIPLFYCTIIAILIIIIIFCFKKMSKLKSQYFFSYFVRISTNSGTSDVLSSPDKQYIQKVVDAINQAIIYQG